MRTVFSRSQITEAKLWEHIVFQFDVLAELGEKCHIPSFKFCTDRALPRPGGV
jgi:hypothetical protein